jgi:Pyruvate/2-oxoacid:ferredoxin oxidoreductase delta subunit
MSAHCNECLNYLAPEEVADTEELEKLLHPDHCIGCHFINIKVNTLKDSNLIN